MGVFEHGLWRCPSSVGCLCCSWLGFGVGLLLGRVWFRGRPACPPPFPFLACGVGVCVEPGSRLCPALLGWVVGVRFLRFCFSFCFSFFYSPGFVVPVPPSPFFRAGLVVLLFFFFFRFGVSFSREPPYDHLTKVLDKEITTTVNKTQKFWVAPLHGAVQFSVQKPKPRDFQEGQWCAKQCVQQLRYVRSTDCEERMPVYSAIVTRVGWMVEDWVAADRSNRGAVKELQELHQHVQAEAEANKAQQAGRQIHPPLHDKDGNLQPHSPWMVHFILEDHGDKRKGTEVQITHALAHTHLNYTVPTSNALVTYGEARKSTYRLQADTEGTAYTVYT